MSVERIDDYISRGRLREMFEPVTNDCTCPLQIAAEIEQILDCVEAEDAAPVVYGRWERPHWRNSDYCCDCSVYGKEAMHREYQWQERGIYPICPNCGARMYQKEEKTDEVQK